MKGNLQKKQDKEKISEKSTVPEKERLHMKKNKVPFHILTMIFAFLLLFLSLLFALTDKRLHAVHYRISDSRIKDEICLVMLSDLHRSLFGTNQGELLALVDEQKPDAVLLCGDIFDEHGEYENAEMLLQALGKKYPCFYVSGNHEYGIETEEHQIREFKRILQECNICRIESGKESLTVGSTTIDLFGIEDENRYTTYHENDPLSGVNFLRAFNALSAEISAGRYSLLLCHRPLPELFKDAGYDLILSGHCHGGQWRLPPFINGFYAPGQGFFPKYAGGQYELGETTLIVGRGLCTTYNLPRICNRPEVVVLHLTPETLSE